MNEDDKMLIQDKLTPAIMADLAKTVSPDIGVMAAPCGGILSQLMAQLMAQLQNCIPAAKTPDGLLAELQKMKLPVRGLWHRLTLGNQLRQAIHDNAGDPADEAAAMKLLFVPLKTSIVNQCSSLTLADTTAAIGDQKLLEGGT